MLHRTDIRSQKIKRDAPRIFQYSIHQAEEKYLNPILISLNVGENGKRKCQPERPGIIIEPY